MHCSRNVVRPVDLRRTRLMRCLHESGRQRNECIILVRTHEGKRPLGRLEVDGRIFRYRVQCRTLVNTVLNLRVYERRDIS